MTKEHYQLARAIAARHNHPSEIVLAYRTRKPVRSVGHPLRAGFSRDTACRNTTPENLDITETYARSMSWGLGQIMARRRESWDSRGNIS